MAYVLYSPTHGVFLRADCNCPFFSKMLPDELEEAQIFDGVASASEMIERVMPNQKSLLEFRRVDIHCFATTATREECVAAGLPSLESNSDQGVTLPGQKGMALRRPTIERRQA
ncbi:MAG: hypothetical protein CBHOC_4268 [uncultured Caballeronia sp.]|nr:MAG: hypothetical protein CBHOC_4268 [uncultured Caballeronia sp.]